MLKDCVLTIKKEENPNNLIRSLRDVDANIKPKRKQFNFYAKPLTFMTFSTKWLSKIMNFASNKPSTFVGVTAIAHGTSSVIKRHLAPMEVSSTGWRRPILQAEKDHGNSPGLFCYCGKVSYIDINHGNFALLASKRQTADITNYLVAFLPCNPSTIEEKQLSLNQFLSGTGL